MLVRNRSRAFALHVTVLSSLLALGAALSPREVQGAPPAGPLTPANRVFDPGPIPKGIGLVAQLAVGGDHTCAVLSDGTVKCWGYNAEGRLGDGTTTNRSSPTPVKW